MAVEKKAKVEHVAVLLSYFSREVGGFGNNVVVYSKKSM